MKLYPHAIFDMDGTLVDSMPYWQSCPSDYLILKGIQPKEGLWEAVALMSTQEAAQFMIREYGLTDPADVIVADYNKIMFENYRLRIPAKPGAAEYLQKLKEAGVTISICSATAVPLVEMTLNRLGLREYFSCLTSCDEVGVGKREPDVFQLAVSRLGVKPEDCVMYEDSDFGIRTAQSIGMHVAGVYDPSCLTESSVVRGWCGKRYIEDYRGISLYPQEV